MEESTILIFLDIYDAAAERKEMGRTMIANCVKSSGSLIGAQ